MIDAWIDRFEIRWNRNSNNIHKFLHRVFFLLLFGYDEKKPQLYSKELSDSIFSLIMFFVGEFLVYTFLVYFSFFFSQLRFISSKNLLWQFRMLVAHR